LAEQDRRADVEGLDNAVAVESIELVHEGLTFEVA